MYAMSHVYNVGYVIPSDWLWRDPVEAFNCIFRRGWIVREQVFGQLKSSLLEQFDYNALLLFGTYRFPQSSAHFFHGFEQVYIPHPSLKKRFREAVLAELIGKSHTKEEEWRRRIAAYVSTEFRYECDRAVGCFATLGPAMNSKVELSRALNARFRECPVEYSLDYAPPGLCNIGLCSISGVLPSQDDDAPAGHWFRSNFKTLAVAPLLLFHFGVYCSSMFASAMVLVPAMKAGVRGAGIEGLTTELLRTACASHSFVCDTIRWMHRAWNYSTYGTSVCIQAPYVKLRRGPAVTALTLIDFTD